MVPLFLILVAFYCYRDYFPLELRFARKLKAVPRALEFKLASSNGRYQSVNCSFNIHEIEAEVYKGDGQFS